MKGEVRRTPSGRVFYVQDAEVEKPWDYVAPMVHLVEVEGSYAGARFLERADKVEGWEVLATRGASDG